MKILACFERLCVSCKQDKVGTLFLLQDLLQDTCYNCLKGGWGGGNSRAKGFMLSLRGCNEFVFIMFSFIMNP